MPLLGTRGAASVRGFGFGAGGGGNWWPLNETFTFTNTGLNGPTGPSNATLVSAYSGQLFLPYFSSTLGVQTLSGVLPGTYRVVLKGARGNAPNDDYGDGGFGATVQGDFVVSDESSFYILVAQRGVKTGSASGYSQPGGGMSAFWIGSLTTASAFGVAGGGGGSVNGQNNTAYNKGSAPQNISGTNSSGTGGGGSEASLSLDYAMSGAGWLANAANQTGNSSSTVATRPLLGGSGAIYAGNGSDGGFGGGGNQTNDGQNRAGGGGGYTGGPGADDSYNGGFGGGSFFSGAINTSYIDANTDTGQVTIQRIA